MTEEEKSRLRELKTDTVRRLTETWPWWQLEYSDQLATDARISEYIQGVVDNPDLHNIYEILAVVRFFDLLGKYKWKVKKARKFIVLYETLRFSGLSKRQSYKLTPIQTFYFANIYGFYDNNDHRLFRDVWLMVPRKFSKTTSSASMAVYDMICGDDNAQAYVGANSYDQAKICFDEISKIWDDLDPSSRTVRRNRQKIYFKSGERNSMTQCLTANAKTKDGLNASLVIMDEYAQARDTKSKPGAALKNTLTSSMGARKEPLTVVISTASEVLDGPFARELAGVQSVLRGEVTNDRLFAMLFMPDVDDEESDPRTWHKVQPHIGITIQEDYYQNEWARAQMSADNMLTFRTKLLNIMTVSSRLSWISPERISKCMKSFRIEDIKGRPAAMCAIDLSESEDFSAVTIGLWQNKEFSFHTDYFIPEAVLDEHANGELYKVWIEQGYLHALPGEVIDYQAIVDYILKCNQYVKLLSIGYDPWKSQEMINMLAAAGAKNVLKPLKQTYGYFTAPVESFEHGVKTGRVFIDDNPINAYCFGNAVLDEDRLENEKPIKRSLVQKIDGVITMLMCMRLFIDFEQ